MASQRFDAATRRDKGGARLVELFDAGVRNGDAVAERGRTAEFAATQCIEQFGFGMIMTAEQGGDAVQHRIAVMGSGFEHDAVVREQAA